ncbi:MAG: TIGR04372 family glycosyltransferase [Bacteroidia bacterium]|nr:TIGR04372 family glycosyltransferase [Bacteroidia bacterium]
MNIPTFFKQQITQIHKGGKIVLFRKMKYALHILLMLPLYIIAIPVVFVMRMVRPWLLVRLGGLNSCRIGHFAANTELYLCERDAGINKPIQYHFNLFYLAHKPICNHQLTTMWKRSLRIWPTWILAPIDFINKMIPGGTIHEVGRNTQNDRDVHNLLDRFPAHLLFTNEEEARGEDGLRNMGISTDAQFVCLIVRDSEYLNAHLSGADCNYHNFRDSNIEKYILAVEELADRDYFVIRMGVHVKDALKSNHPKVIDYATNGMRNDFMDIYLGAKCDFCISVGTGFDAIPLIFRRPVVYVNMVPLGYLFTFSNQFLGITKHHILVEERRELTLREIFYRKVGFSLQTSDFTSKGIELNENTSEEIRDVVIEMAERINGSWQPQEDDEILQKRFWEIFPIHAVRDTNGIQLHGQIRALFGANFLRNNIIWLK